MNFRERRMALGLSQREVGEIAGGMTQPLVSQVERGAAYPIAVSRVAAALTKIEIERGVTPPRDFRLRARRLALRLSEDDLAERAFFRPMFGPVVRRAEIGQGRPAEIRAIRRALIWEESASRRRREELRRDRARVALQESLFACLQDHPKFDELVSAMLDRCRDLMHDGRWAECDALSEWLPADRVRAMFERWSIEDSADRACGRCEPLPVDLTSPPTLGDPDGKHRTEGAGPARAA